MSDHGETLTHARVEEWIARQRVEGLSAAEQELLSTHLGECVPCAEKANATAEALRALRTMPVGVPRDLARRTQFRVRLRARELQLREPRWRIVWLASAASWLFGAVTAPYVWRGLEWLGTTAGAPKLLWQLSFGVWWALPAIVAGVILLIENAGRAPDSML